jgi:ATP-dependent RNA helicase DeaD
MQTFEALGVSPDLLKGVEQLGFEHPTPIQEKIIPLFHSAQSDIIGLAQTGTGKTAAFGLPILDTINPEHHHVQALILSPTRELCMQITSDLEKYAHYLRGVKIVAVYGGASIENQIKALKSGAHIIVATPGRMLDLSKRKFADISRIETLVLDEADEMLNMGFREELDKILEKSPAEKRTMLFSATMSGEIATISKNYLKNPVQITIGKKNAGADNVRHIYYQVHAADRYLALKRIADINPDIYSIVFCRTRTETKDVADKLIKDGYSADALHGDLSQAQRDHVMKRFRERNLQMLVATDVAARGIDVTDISHIINYNLPDELEIYVHRSGRTGRAEKSGVSIAIVNYREKSKIPVMEKMIGKKFEKLPVPTGLEICKKQLFKLIDKMEKVEVDEDQIAHFMPEVNKKLEWLTKEQIIKHFVSLEFNRFLDYYKNAKDLNEPNKAESKFEKDRSGKKNRSYETKQGGGNFARFFISVGKKDGMTNPKYLIGLINDVTNDRRLRIGTIDLKDSFSFFEVEDKSAGKVIKAFKNQVYKDRKIKLEPADGLQPAKGKKKTGRRRD